MKKIKYTSPTVEITEFDSGNIMLVTISNINRKFAGLTVGGEDTIAEDL